MIRAALLLIMAICLSACGLRPLYEGGSPGKVGTILGAVDVPPLNGKAGWLVRNALNDRFGAVRREGARYRLVIEIDDQISGFGVRTDDSVTRERRTLRARYKLVEIGSDKTLFDTTAGVDAGIDVVSSEYATVAAENTALENLAQSLADQIFARVALYAQRGEQATGPDTTSTAPSSAPGK